MFIYSNIFLTVSFVEIMVSSRNSVVTIGNLKVNIAKKNKTRTIRDYREYMFTN